MDKKYKDVLMPTLISATYKSERALAIADQEMNMKVLVDYMEHSLKEELPRIIEEENDYQSISSLNEQRKGGARSPSISSTNSSSCSVVIDHVSGNSPYVPLIMRFPKKHWKDAMAFYSKML